MVFFYTTKPASVQTCKFTNALQMSPLPKFW